MTTYLHPNTEQRIEHLTRMALPFSTGEASRYDCANVVALGARDQADVQAASYDLAALMLRLAVGLDLSAGPRP